MKKEEYKCKDCALHEHDPEPEKCKEQDKEHNVCSSFHPAEYINQLNYDTR